MANELYLSAVTGLTPIGQLYIGTTPYGTTFAFTEIAATGEYIANMPTAPYNKYLVLVTSGDFKIGTGEIYWDGSYEINQSVAMLRGLDPNNPAEQTLTNLTSGDIDIVVSGDPSTDVTFTRAL